ncbi:MAG: FAD/NAD(P)-binding oxidoreductase [Nitrospiraceae bacterium]|nr:FAD/NAD(P)-binding oxidoreductase [Nitrospiraceae bacterium]
MHHVILGGSIAAASAAAAIRGKDPRAEITVVSPETPFYFRPLIPMLMDGSRRMEDISYAGQVKDVTRLISDRAEGLDTKRCVVALESGGELGYDRLLIATGSAPLIPEIPGAGALLPLRTAADALELRKAASNAKDALVVGGGLVGIKAALALGKLGLRVTIVEKLAHLLHPRLDSRGAAAVEERLRLYGIRVITGETVAEVSTGKARLSGGALIEAPLIAVAIGSAPCTGWLRGSGLKADGGICVDENLMAGAGGVFAAGDAASFTDTVTGLKINSALWTNAVEMGRIAGENMAGGKLVCPGIWRVLNATEICGIPMVSAGKTEADPGEEAYAGGHFGYRKLIFDGPRLKGMLFMGDVKGAGIYTNIIRNRTELSERQKQKAIEATLGYADFAMAGAR